MRKKTRNALCHSASKKQFSLFLSERVKKKFATNEMLCPNENKYISVHDITGAFILYL